MELAAQKLVEADNMSNFKKWITQSTRWQVNKRTAKGQDLNVLPDAPGETAVDAGRAQGEWTAEKGQAFVPTQHFHLPR